MKRKTADYHHCEVTVTYVKRERYPGARAPNTLLPEPIPLSSESKSLLNLQEPAQFHFIIFLDAQGKEFVSDIATLCLRHLSQTIFCTSYEDFTTKSYRMTDTQTCKVLAKELKILNPIGGGAYPLNHLVVMDALGVVYCRIPIRLGRYYGSHQRFGTSLLELPGILEEYEMFARMRGLEPVVGEDVVMAT